MIQASRFNKCSKLKRQLPERYGFECIHNSDKQ